MKKIELLAPAGSVEALKLAVMAGCDAVYLGGKSFGARAFSTNFTNDELVDAIKYCHLYGVKVYVTCNTLIFEDEVEDFLNYVRFLHQNNVDAILIQDIGMLDLLRKKFPNLEIHSSTQMHIHNLDGVKLMEKLGVKRVVLARETSLDTLKYIKENTNVDLEVFGHGSLCMSYSGECLMSFFLGGRSGNRGECAGSCRLNYDVISNKEVINKEDKYPLSCRDLCTIYDIDKIIAAGISSLKIEGRMKSPYYVYIVTKLYRDVIDNYYQTGKVIVNEKLLKDLKKIFNREYTRGYLFNSTDIINPKRPNNNGILIGKVINVFKNIITIKLLDDIHIGDGLRIVGSKDVGVIVNDFYKDKKLVKEAKKDELINLKVKDKVDINANVYLTSSKYINNSIDEYINKYSRKVKIDMIFNGYKNNNISLEVSDGINNVKVLGNKVDIANNISTTKEDILLKLNKLGNTIYEINNIKVNIDNNIFIPLKEINELRRVVLNKLDTLRIGKSNFKEEEYFIDLKDYPVKKEKTCLLVNNNKVNNEYDKTYILNKNYYLPVIDKYNNIVNGSLVSELGALNINTNVDTDYTLNVCNSYAVAFLHSLGVNKVTLSLELEEEKIKDLISSYHNRYHKHPNVEVICYYYPILMISKFNFNKYYNKDNLLLKDRYNKYYKILRLDDISLIISNKLINKEDINYYDMGVNSVRINLNIKTIN